MKNLFVLILTMSMLLCGCSTESSVEITVPETAAAGTVVSETTIPEDTSVSAEITVPELIAFGEVLDGRRDFIETYTGEHWDISRLGETITTEDIPCSVRQLAVVDLNQDGAQEAVLWLKLGQDDYAGFEVLHYRDGEVYGYSFSYRSFQELKEDGTFWASGGASYSGIGTVQFNDSNAVVTSIAERREEFVEDGSSTMQFFINQEPVGEAEFQLEEQQQTAKPNAVWYESWEAYLYSR